MTHMFQRPLPPELAGLVPLALDLRWTWCHAADRLWRMAAPDVWARARNPWLILQSVSDKRLDTLAHDASFRAEVERITEERRAYLTAETWWTKQGLPPGRDSIAYFCMEYGLAEALPLYSGGLGILAGDHLKTASDLGVPMVAVGLLYQEGYFRQMLDGDGNQIELYPLSSPGSLPLQPVRDADGGWLAVHVELPGRDLLLRAWRAEVGRVALYLLDANDPMNAPADRGITSKLYPGNADIRVMQAMAIGIGGWRLLEALALAPDVCHINESQTAFVTLERARAFAEARQTDFEDALWATRAGNVFTTHSATGAGFASLPVPLRAKYGRRYAERLGVPEATLRRLGQAPAARDSERFELAYLAMRTCAHVNGVSALHGSVARRAFQPLFPRWPERDVPIDHVTNGVHMPSWDSAWADSLWTEACGKQRWLGQTEELTDAILALDDLTLWAARPANRRIARGFSMPLDRSPRSRAWRPQRYSPSRPSMPARA